MLRYTQEMETHTELDTLLQKKEGRRIEFKSQIPTKSDLAKTVVAFANDAGGDILIGVNDDSTIVGVKEEDLPRMEEQLCNIIYDMCYPAILPEITFLCVDGKHILRLHIYRGSMPPYHLKSNGRINGTFIRVGSTNRKADIELIAELERIRRRISYDGEIVSDKPWEEVVIDSFARLYNEKTGEKLDIHALRKLDLIRSEQGREYPTRALILLSDDPLRRSLFPYAKIECARFKGTTAEYFIDQKSITAALSQQAEEAFEFVLRHINESAVVEGVYTVKRWEYPVQAIREVIRNAVVHRQYAREGMDIKVAIYDDMVEITSPGQLPPTIDYSAMTARQSDARNKTLAGVFKKLGIIDQWGNGLVLIAEELKHYPGIEFHWQEVGLSFQVQFIKVQQEPRNTDIPQIPMEQIMGSLSELEQQIIHYIASQGFAKRSELSKAFKKDPRTIAKKLLRLEQAGLICVNGSTNSPMRSYRLAER